MQSRVVVLRIRHSQKTPVNLGGQEQVKLSTPSMHVPPFIHLREGLVIINLELI